MKNISIFLSAISRKNGGSSTILDLASRLKKLNKNIRINSLLGFFDLFLYQPKYFDSKKFSISVFSVNDLRINSINFFKKIINTFFRYREPKEDIDLIIDASILKKSSLLKFKKGNTKAILNHAGSPIAFKEYFLRVKSFDEYLDFCSSYDGLIFQSKNQMNLYLKFRKDFMQEQKFFCCVPPANENQIRDTLAIEKKRSSENKKIACIGSIQPRKNQEEIIDFAKELLKDTKDFQFQIIGNYLDKNYVRMLQEKISENNLQENIVILGFRNDYLKIMHNADFILHPSKEEGVSRVIREAMALGKLVIAYDLEGTLDLISSEAELYLCKDKTEMLDALVLALKNNKTIKDYESKSFRRYWNDLSEKSYNEKLKKFLISWS